jgi:hypothetical protein
MCACPSAKAGVQPLEIEVPFLDFIQDITKVLNDLHDEYRGFKKELRGDYDLQYAMQVSTFPLWGNPKGGLGMAELRSTELYHSYTILRGLRLTPDVQLYFTPALQPGAGPAAVFTIRTTAFFRPRRSRWP